MGGKNNRVRIRLRPDREQLIPTRSTIRSLTELSDLPTGTPALPLRSIMGQHLRLIGAFLALLFLGCRKDKDESAPRVQFLAPISGIVYAVPDTIDVRVSVSDDNVVEGVTISLQDANGTTVAVAPPATISATSGTVERRLIVSNERLTSGAYTLIARASDGTNDGRAFLDITLLEAPLRLRSIFLAPPFTADMATVKKVDSLGMVSDVLNVQDLNGVAVSSFSQHLFVAGYQFAPLLAIPTSTTSTPWQVNTTANNVPEQFTAVTVDPTDNGLYFGTRDGAIRGYSGSGVPLFSAQCMVGHRCEAIVVMGGMVATWQRAIVGGAAIVVRYFPSGTAVETLPVDHSRVALYSRTDASLLLFANNSGQGLIEDINIVAAGSPEVRSFNEGEIRAVARLDANNYAVALPSRVIRFNYPTNTIAELATGITANALAYEPATGTLFVAQGTDLLYMDANTGVIVNMVATATAIGHILPLRNR